MRNVFSKLHLWLSIPFGLIISIICFSGASLVFENEVMELLYPERYFVEREEEESLPIDSLVRGVSAFLPEGVAVRGVVLSGDKERMYQVLLSKPRRAVVLVDQYTGEVKGMKERGSFFEVMFSLHRWLLGSMTGMMSIGKLIVGVSTGLFVFVLVSGVVIWVPKRRGALKYRMKVAMGKGWRRFWYDMHVSMGIYVVLFLLVMALTGLTWSFSWYRTGFYGLFGVEPQASVGSYVQGSEKENVYLLWQRMLDAVRSEALPYKEVSFSGDALSVSYYGFGNQRAADHYVFDEKRGVLKPSRLYDSQEDASKIGGWIYSVHVGSWGGFFTRVLWFLAAFVGGTLPLTGYYIWIKRLTGRRRLK